MFTVPPVAILGDDEDGIAATMEDFGL